MVSLTSVGPCQFNSTRINEASAVPGIVLGPENTEKSHVLFLPCKEGHNPVLRVIFYIHEYSHRWANMVL